MKRTILALLTLSLVAMFGVACDREGPLERAGEEVDEAIDDAERGIDDAVD